MNSVQQQCEHHHKKVLIKSFHLSGHTFRFCWTVQDFEVFLVYSKIHLMQRTSTTLMQYVMTFFYHCPNLSTN